MEESEKELQENLDALKRRYKKAKRIESELCSSAEKFGKFLDEKHDKIDTSNYEMEAQRIYDEIFGKESDEKIKNLSIDKYLARFTRKKLEEYFSRTIEYLESTSKRTDDGK